MNETYIDQALNISSIRHFLTRLESVLLFLALTFAFTTLLVVFGQPTSLTEFTDQPSSISKLGQISITFVSGFSLLTLSRMSLFLVGRKYKLQLIGILVWLVGELILCVSVMALVLWALSGGGKVMLAEMVGTLVLGYIGILLMPAVVSFLILRLYECQLEISYLRRHRRQPENPTGQQSETVINFFAKNGKLAFSTKLSSIIYLEGADNYANIHYINGDKEETFILYNTLKNVEKDFKDTCIVRCHRRYMVNAENVKVMRKDNTGLQLEMNQCQRTIPVSKSFVEPITRYFAYNSMFIPTE